MQLNNIKTAPYIFVTLDSSNLVKDFTPFYDISKEPEYSENSFVIVNRPMGGFSISDYLVHDEKTHKMSFVVDSDEGYGFAITMANAHNIIVRNMIEDGEIQNSGIIGFHGNQLYFFGSGNAEHDLIIKNSLKKYVPQELEVGGVYYTTKYWYERECIYLGDGVFGINIDDQYWRFERIDLKTETIFDRDGSVDESIVMSMNCLIEVNTEEAESKSEATPTSSDMHFSSDPLEKNIFWSSDDDARFKDAMRKISERKKSK